MVPTSNKIAVGGLVRGGSILDFSTEGVTIYFTIKNCSILALKLNRVQSILNKYTKYTISRKIKYLLDFSDFSNVAAMMYFATKTH